MGGSVVAVFSHQPARAVEGTSPRCRRTPVRIQRHPEAAQTLPDVPALIPELPERADKLQVDLRLTRAGEVIHCGAQVVVIGLEPIEPPLRVALRATPLHRRRETTWPRTPFPECRRQPATSCFCAPGRNRTYDLRFRNAVELVSASPFDSHLTSSPLVFRLYA